MLQSDQPAGNNPCSPGSHAGSMLHTAEPYRQAPHSAKRLARPAGGWEILADSGNPGARPALVAADVRGRIRCCAAECRVQKRRRRPTLIGQRAACSISATLQVLLHARALAGLASKAYGKAAAWAWLFFRHHGSPLVGDALISSLDGGYASGSRLRGYRNAHHAWRSISEAFQERLKLTSSHVQNTSIRVPTRQHHGRRPNRTSSRHYPRHSIFIIFHRNGICETIKRHQIYRNFAISRQAAPGKENQTTANTVLKKMSSIPLSAFTVTKRFAKAAGASFYVRPHTGCAAEPSSLRYTRRRNQQVFARQQFRQRIHLPRAHAPAPRHHHRALTYLYR